MGKFSQDGKPDNVDPLWDSVFSHLSGAFWSHKGMSGQCPFCFVESTPQKMKFLIRFVDNEFKGYSCFVCPEGRGSGYKGILKLARQINVDINSLEAGSMSGESGSRFYKGNDIDEDEDSEIKTILWPDVWIEDSEEVVKKGVAYLESRGILNVLQSIEKYDLQFSEVVLVNVKGEAMLKDYHCLLAPMAGEDGIIGWAARRLGESDDPNEPKSIAYSGKGWKTESLFGIREIDPRKPVTIVEGIMDWLSTPNSVAIGGKDLSSGQIALLAETGASVFIFALDPTVDKKNFSTMMYRLHMEAPGCKVLNVKWEQFGLPLDRDPNDRGWAEMEKIIRKTVLDSIV